MYDLFSESPACPARDDMAVAHLVPGPVLHLSPPMRIGRHDWAYVLYRHPSYGTLGAYIWRPAGAGRHDWSRDEQWPRYDSNNGSTGGMPATLRRLWESQAAARAALGHGARQ